MHEPGQRSTTARSSRGEFVQQLSWRLATSPNPAQPSSRRARVPSPSSRTGCSSSGTTTTAGTLTDYRAVFGTTPWASLLWAIRPVWLRVARLRAQLGGKPGPPGAVDPAGPRCPPEGPRPGLLAPAGVAHRGTRRHPSMAPLINAVHGRMEVVLRRYDHDAERGASGSLDGSDGHVHRRDREGPRQRVGWAERSRAMRWSSPCAGPPHRRVRCVTGLVRRTPPPCVPAR